MAAFLLLCAAALLVLSQCVLAVDFESDDVQELLETSLLPRRGTPSSSLSLEETLSEFSLKKLDDVKSSLPDKDQIVTQLQATLDEKSEAAEAKLRGPRTKAGNPQYTSILGGFLPLPSPRNFVVAEEEDEDDDEEESLMADEDGGGGGEFGFLDVETSGGTLMLDGSGGGLTAEAGGECVLQTSVTGIQYCDVIEGTGAAPVNGQKIEVHYIGKLTNGKKFDASYDRGRPLPLRIGVGQVIRGWDVGIVGADDIPPMMEGGKRIIVIPPELGYGDRGAGGVIPGGATLVFEVELLNVN